MSARFALAGLAALLILLAIAEAMAPADAVIQPVTPARQAARIAVPGAIPGMMQAARLIAAITARPLFRPDRRPVAAVQAGNSESLPRLSGILIGGGLRLAIFTSDSGKTRLVRQGDALGAYRVSRIMPGHVTLISSDTRVVLMPRFAKMANIADLSAQPSHSHPPVPRFDLPGKN